MKKQVDVARELLHVECGGGIILALRPNKTISGACNKCGALWILSVDVPPNADWEPIPKGTGRRLEYIAGR